MFREVCAAATFLVVHFIIGPTPQTFAQGPPPRAPFVVPASTDPLFGFNRGDPRTTYAEWVGFENSGGGGGRSPILPNNSPEFFSGFAAGEAVFEAFNNRTMGTLGGTGGQAILRATDGSVTVPSRDFQQPDLRTTVAVQVDVAADIWPTIPLDGIDGLPTSDPFLDTESPSVDAASARLSSPLLTDIVPNEVVRVAASYGFRGRDDDIPTLFTTTLFVFDVTGNEASYTVDFGLENRIFVDNTDPQNPIEFVVDPQLRSVAVDTFAVPEPSAFLIAALVGGVGLVATRLRKG